MTTIGDTISRVRNVVKGVKEDAFLTDRFIDEAMEFGKLMGDMGKFSALAVEIDVSGGSYDEDETPF